MPYFSVAPLPLHPIKQVTQHQLGNQGPVTAEAGSKRRLNRVIEWLEEEPETWEGEVASAGPQIIGLLATSLKFSFFLWSIFPLVFQAFQWLN